MPPKMETPKIPVRAKSAKKSVKRGVKKVKRSDPAFTTLRKSVTPGTIAIMLAGRYRGRRVVVLKQLPSNGPLVINGPFRVNGVPLRRVNSRYIIATTTSVDISKIDVSSITNETFQRAKREKRVKGEGEFMGDKAKKSAEKSAKKTKLSRKAVGKGGKVSDERRSLQKKVDAGIVAALKLDKQGKEKAGYLKSIFTIKSGDQPHRLKW